MVDDEHKKDVKFHFYDLLYAHNFEKKAKYELFIFSPGFAQKLWEGRNQIEAARFLQWWRINPDVNGSVEPNDDDVPTVF